MRTAIIASTNQWVEICDSTDLDLDSMFSYEHEGKWVVVYRINDGIYATDNICSHAFALLSDGWLEGESVECPLHGALFNIKTGAVERGLQNVQCRPLTLKKRAEKYTVISLGTNLSAQASSAWCRVT